MAALSVLWVILLLSCSKLLQGARRNSNALVVGRTAISNFRADASSNNQANLCAADWPPMFYTTGKKYFYVVSNWKLNWFGAYEYCAMRQSRLARVQSQEDSKAVNDLIRTTPGVFLWLGGNDLAEEGRWKWLLNGEAVGVGAHSSWVAGEPNNHGGREHCLAFGYYDHYHQGYSWNDLDCQQKHGFVCEYYR